MKLNSALSQRSDYKWWVFGAIAIGSFVSVLDQTSVNLALPRIADDFDATIPAVQWVTLAYSLTTSSLLLPMGRLSDIVGRKRIYILGFFIFTLGAILAGSSPALIAIILFKVLQGVGASMIQGNAMAITMSAFPNSERGKVIGLFMTTVGLGAIVGPVVGGAVVGFLGWRYVFFMAVPFGLASIAASSLILQGRAASEAQRADGRPGFDWAGAILSTAALAIFLVVMTVSYRIGWGSPLVVFAFAGVATLFVAFVWWELRTPQPMLALELFRRRLFSMGVSASFLNFLAGSSVFFLMPFYLQDVLGYAPGQAGLLMMPTALCFAVVGPIAGRLSDRFGWRWFTVGGVMLSATSLLLLSQLDERSPIGLVVGAMLLQGIGMGTFNSPNTSAVLSTVERSRYGVGTAFLNMVRNTAGVTGVALATTIVTITMGSMGYEPTLDAVRSGSGGEGVKSAFTQGLTTSYMVMGSLLIVAIALSLLQGRALKGKEEPAPQESGRVATPGGD